MERHVVEARTQLPLDLAELDIAVPRRSGRATRCSVRGVVLHLPRATPSLAAWRRIATRPRSTHRIGPTDPRHQASTHRDRSSHGWNCRCRPFLHSPSPSPDRPIMPRPRSKGSATPVASPSPPSQPYSRHLPHSARVRSRTPRVIRAKVFHRWTRPSAARAGGVARLPVAAPCRSRHPETEGLRQRNAHSAWTTRISRPARDGDS